MLAWLKAAVLNQIWLKLFSLLLAMLVWLAVHANVAREISAREFDAREATRNFLARPILILNDSGGHAPVSVEPATVDVALRGPAGELERLDDGEVRAFVRVPDRGDFSGPLPVQVQRPAGTSLILAAPTTVQVKPSTKAP